VSASNGRIVVVEDAITLVYGELLATIPERCDPATPPRERGASSRPGTRPSPI
jgi:hypothetical protein